MRFCRAIVLFVILTTSTVAAQSKGPVIEFQKTNVDLGTVIQGEAIKQVFDFVNKGGATLQILDVEHS